jgi:DNA-damage-inducible protein D
MNNMILFESKPVRRVWNEKEQQWYFSIDDIVLLLTNSTNVKDYIKKLRKRDTSLDSYWGTNCPLVEMVAADGKLRKIRAAQAQALLRIIQSIPSPKAEPVKLWLAKVGYERMQDMADPARSLDRAREFWQKHGRSEKWIQQRMMGQETRNKLTDYWKTHEITKEEEYAILTNIIHEEWSDVTVKTHKAIKGLKTQNLRDHMSEAELIFTALAELSTRQIAETMDAIGMPENEIAGKKGGGIAKKARLELEEKTGRRVVTGENYLPPVVGKDAKRISEKNDEE